MAPTEPGGGGLGDQTTSSGYAGNTEAKPKSTMPPRSRRLHTRSRAGCITCRKRHVKCDEARPICLNCTTGARECVYPDVSLTLRDRRAKERALPGAQVVWSVTASETSSASSIKTSSNDAGSGRSRSPLSSSPTAQLVLNHQGLDPFDTLGIKMQFKSRELFHYFYHSADSLGVGSKDVNKDCLALVAHDPTALRSTLILAAIHYAWNMGQLATFEQTYIATKIEAIRAVNDWIRSNKETAFVNAVRLVATLCLAEVSTGNMTLAEAHLDGLTALLEANQSKRATMPALDLEVNDRYIMMVYNFVHGFKSRLTDILRFDTDHGDPAAATEEEANALVRSHHEQETGGIDIRLKVFRIIPTFFAPPQPGTKVKDVDIQGFLLCMDQLTRVECRRQNARGTGSWASSWNMLWMEGAASRLFYAFIDSHAKSFSTEPEPVHWGAPGFRGLTSSWLGIGTATGLYLYGVLGFWNAGLPMKTGLLVQVLSILLRDIDATWPVYQTGAHASKSDLWLWKVFTGACALWRTLETGGESSDALEIEKVRLMQCVTHWSDIANVTVWEGARAALMKIVWMTELDSDAMGRRIWDECIAGQARTNSHPFTEPPAHSTAEYLGTADAC